LFLCSVFDVCLLSLLVSVCRVNLAARNAEFRVRLAGLTALVRVLDHVADVKLQHESLLAGKGCTGSNHSLLVRSKVSRLCSCLQLSRSLCD